MQSTLLNVIRSVESWHMFYAELSKNSNSGYLFEEFCKYYYLTEPSVCSEYENVWFFKEIPEKIRTKLNLGRIDHGADLILEDKEGGFTLVQCKFRRDQDSILSWSKDKISNLFGEGGKADHLVVFTNASGLDKHSLDKQKIKLVCHGDLLEIPTSTFDKITKRLSNQPLPITIKKPRPYQEEAIRNVIDGFKTHPRGQLILPCGAGKTLTALWIKENVESKKTLVLVPSLALLRQIKNEWSANINGYIPYMCVCSENDIDKGSDHLVEYVYNIQGNVSTEPSKIKAFLEKHSEAIIYCTYQSLEQIRLATEALQYQFDLAICDEAHKTAGSKRSAFGLVHDEGQIKIRRRLYMTATPRITGEALKQSTDSETLKLICDMGNPEIYGPEFHRMTFKEAIEQNILCDYKIAAIGISNKELQEAITLRKYIKTNATIDEIANNYALAKFMDEHQAHHAITFHSSIKKAQAFADRHIEQYQATVNSYHVNGQLTTNKRSRIMDDFKKSPKAIMTNARCLTEGVDIPTIDVVYFCDPKNSKIDIVQAAGRALRRSTGKKFGYIVVPIYHNREDLLEKTIKNGSFKNLMAVIRGLLDHDERLVAEITKIKLGEGLRKNGVLNISIDLPLELISMEGFEKELRDSIFVQLMEKIRVSWRSFLEARSFVHTLNLKNREEWQQYCFSGEKPADIPVSPEKAYKDKGWLGVGDWLGTGVVATYDRNYLSFEVARSFVHTLNLKNREEWQKYCASSEKPADIPVAPCWVYKNTGWASWGDWLGTGTIANQNKQYRLFYEARSFVQMLNLKSNKQWQKYCLSGKKPLDIPTCPDKTYEHKGWKSWGDWLGTGIMASQDIQYLPFETARFFVHQLNLKNREEWQNYCFTGKKPSNIPSKPSRTYKDKGWNGVGDWLGTGVIASQNRIYLSFEEARLFVHKLNLKNYEEWKKYCKNDEKPINIPTCPERTYKDKGWTGRSDWLGCITIAQKNKEYRPFESAKLFVQMLNLKNRKEWQKYCTSGKKPNDIPICPENIYKGKGWLGVGDWLGTGVIAAQNREYLLFEKAKLFVQNLNFKHGGEWRSYCASGQKPFNIPSNPDKTYKHEGWKGMWDWLGTNQYRDYLSFENAKLFVCKLNLKSGKEWKKYCDSGDKPSNIPVAPNTVYKNEGWASWGDWLGTGIVASRGRQYRSFELARSFTHTLNLKSREEWQQYCTSGEKPADIPAKPERIYQDKGWESVGDWLGTGTIAPKNKKYRSFEEARSFVRALKFSNRKEWQKYCKNGNKPNDIPAHPEGTYKDKGWKGVKDWLGYI